METDSLCGGEFWKAADFAEPKKGTVQDEGVLTDSKFLDAEGKPKKKLIIGFKVGKETKKVSLNATSIGKLRDAYGKNSKQWIGKTAKGEKQVINGKDCLILIP